MWKWDKSDPCILGVITMVPSIFCVFELNNASSAFLRKVIYSMLDTSTGEMYDRGLADFVACGNAKRSDLRHVQWEQLLVVQLNVRRYSFSFLDFPLPVGACWGFVSWRYPYCAGIYCSFRFGTTAGWYRDCLRGLGDRLLRSVLCCTAIPYRSFLKI